MWNELFCESQRKKWVDFLYFILSLFNHIMIFIRLFLISFQFFLIYFFFRRRSCQKSIGNKFCFCFLFLNRLFQKMKLLWNFYIRFCATLKKKIIVFLLQLNYRCSQIFCAVLFFNSFTALLKILCTKLFWRYAKRKMILCVTYLGNLFNSTLRKFVPYESFQSLYIKEINKYM